MHTIECLLAPERSKPANIPYKYNEPNAQKHPQPLEWRIREMPAVLQRGIPTVDPLQRF